MVKILPYMVARERIETKNHVAFEPSLHSGNQSVR